MGVQSWRRGALRQRVPLHTRCALGAKRTPSKGFFGEPAEGEALDTMLRGLVIRGVLFWEGTAPSPEKRPEVYRFTHKTGIKVWVVASWA